VVSEQLRLYVWRGIWADYTAGVAFALARSVEEARTLVQSGMGYAADGSDWWAARGLADEPEVYDAPYGFGVFGGG